MAWQGESFDDSRDLWNNSSYNGENRVTGREPTTGGATRIADLAPGPNATNIFVVGIVIAKEDARSFFSKKDPSNERHLLSFTVRDSPVDFINATCWGSREHIADLAQLFHIGDIVKITQPGIQTKPLDGSDEKFRPWTPSVNQLNVSEMRSSLQLYSGGDLASYNSLFHIPVKPSNDFYTIADILTNGQALHGQYISILAAVKHVGPAKHLTTKTGKQKQRCEVKLFDDTSSVFALVLWDDEHISLAQTWTPREHVIFAADVKVTFDDYRKTMVSTASSKTIFTVNPDTQEAHHLYNYAQSVDFESGGTGNTSEFDQAVDLDSIENVYSVTELKTKQSSQEGGGVICAIIYAFLTVLNLDAELNLAVTERCSSCHCRVDGVSGTCVNQDCPQGSTSIVNTTDPRTETTFDMRVTVSDHTGSIHNCYLSGDVAEQMLGCTVAEFLAFNDDQKTSLKWKFLLERCKLYVKISQPSFGQQKTISRILRCSLAEPQQAAAALHPHP